MKVRPISSATVLVEGCVAESGRGRAAMQSSLQPNIGLAACVPGVSMLRHCRRAWLGRDIVAGLVLTTVLVPAGMAYAEAAGLPAITGLYATIVPLVAYAIFGPSRIMVLGPDSGLAALIAAVVLGSSDAGPEHAIALASLLAIMTGLLTKFFALAIGVACLGIILGIRVVRPKAPGVLVAVVLATLAVALLPGAGPIAVVGAVPRGLPLPAWPSVGLSEVGDVFVGAVGIALVSFADTSVLSRTFAGRHGYRVDPNRELIGLGVANLAGGFFGGFPVSSSASRTPVAESAGSKSPITGVVGAICEDSRWDLVENE